MLLVTRVTSRLPTRFTRIVSSVVILLACVTGAAHAQAHEHRPGMQHPGSDDTKSAPRVTSAGQGAFAAISEIVRLLEADSTTDWSKVDIEKLRRHLIDMDEVTLRSVVVQSAVDGGARFTVTGTGRTVGAIRRMTTAHAAMLSSEDAGYRATVRELPDGAEMTVIAKAGDAKAVTRLRALGFIGLMTVGDHHGPHHLAMARGAGH